MNEDRHKLLWNNYQVQICEELFRLLTVFPGLIMGLKIESGEKENVEEGEKD